MHFSRDLLLFALVAILTSQGCGDKSGADAPRNPAATASGTNASVSQPVINLAAERSEARPPLSAKPSAEQIGRWEAPKFEPLELLTCRDGFKDPAVQCMALSPDRKQFVLGGAKLTLWNATDAQPVVDLLANYKSGEVERPISSVAISADGKWIAAGDQKGTVRIWTSSDQREVAAIPAHDGHVTQIAFSPNSHLLATTSYSGEVAVWQLPDGKRVNNLRMSEQEIRRLEFISDSLLAVAGSETGLWNIESGKKETVLPTKPGTSPAFGVSQDRRFLAFADTDSTIRVWDLRDSKPAGSPLRGAAARDINFSPDGKWIATYGGSTIRIWNAASVTVSQVIDADGGRIGALAWLADGALLVASEDDRVCLWGTDGAAKSLGVERIKLPALAASPAGDRRSLSSAQFERVIDLRSFPRLPGAIPQWGEFGILSYTAQASQSEAETFYRYVLGKAGWTESARLPAESGLVFRKDGCQLGISFAPAAEAGGAKGDLQVNSHFPGNYDVRWLPKIFPLDSRSSWESFSSVSYRTKADLTDVEVALLKQFHKAGWTACARLGSSGREEPDSRMFSMLQGGSVLNVYISRPADSRQELAVQTSVGVSNKSLPIPPDAGFIEFDSSTDLQLVANSKMDLKQTIEFFDRQMAAEGWLARDAGRQIKDDKGWLPYIRGEQQVLLRLAALPGGGTRIVVGDAAKFSWQLKEPASGKKGTEPKAKQPGIEAADLPLPVGAMAVKYDVDEKQIEFEFAGTTPTKLGEQFAAKMQSLHWPRNGSGLISDEYVLLTFTNEKAEIDFRASVNGQKNTAMIGGNGLLWDKPLPTPPVRISYETWLRRGHKPATLDLLDEFSAEMHKIPTGDHRP